MKKIKQTESKQIKQQNNAFNLEAKVDSTGYIHC